MMEANDRFTIGYAAAIADLVRLDGGSNVRAGELLRNLGGIAKIKGIGVCREDMNVLRKVERIEGR